MATNWIKMRADLIDDPKIDLLSELIGLEDFAVIGRLHLLWCKVGDYSEDGIGLEWTYNRIDKIVNCSGFAEAMVQVGWLQGATRNLTFPNFTEHNGATAKRRAQDSARMDRKRHSRKSSEHFSTREDKRREDKRNTKDEEGPAASNSAAPVRWSESGGFEVCQVRIDGWVKACPKVDIQHELATAHSWYIDNPDRRKKSHARFLGSWMRRAQDDAANPKPSRGGMQSHAKQQDSWNHPEDFGGAA